MRCPPLAVPQHHGRRGNHHFPSEARAELAAKLVACTPGDLHYTVFASGGSEAVDVAIKSARRHTGRLKIVAMESGYHGHTGLSGAAGDDANARYFVSDQRAEFVKVPLADLEAMRAALAGQNVAAVILETIPATCGFPLPPDDYLPGVAALCHEHGALYIADEVQTGPGRTGWLWGSRPGASSRTSSSPARACPAACIPWWRRYCARTSAAG